MKSTFLNYKGLYGESINPSIVDFIHSEPLETRSKLFNWEIEDHVHSDLFQIFLIKTGGGILIAGSKKLDLVPTDLILIPPHNVHGFHFAEETTGYVLTIADEYMEALIKELPWSPISGHDTIFDEHIQVYSFLHLFNEFNHLHTIIQWVHDELIDARLQKKQALQSYFQLLLIGLYRSKARQQHIAPLENQRMLQYFHTFQLQIRQSILKPKSITQYASGLNITTVHLNRICRTLVAKSALVVVQELVIRECKKYLLNTSYTIAEISYLFNFTDPTYFTRVFKRLTGVTPREFRR